MNFFEKYPEEKLTKWFKIAAIAEGITCFLLYCVAMPLKYSYDILPPIIVAGNIHGLFFTLYLLLCLPARKIFSWDDEDFVFAILAAFFPFATIWVEKKLAKKSRE